MIVKLALLASPLSLAAVLITKAPPTPTFRAETEEERACVTEGSRIGHATVRVAWTTIRRIDDQVEAVYCVFRGDADSPLAFERNADRVRFALINSGDEFRESRFQFVVHTAENQRVELREASIRMAPRNQLSCRIEVCQAFTDPGDHVVSVEVRGAD
jgi:hypothetical protein